MANSHFTAYLGRHVSFFVPFYSVSSFIGSDTYHLVTGIIDSVCLHISPDQTSFFCNDDNYSFSDVIFLDHIVQCQDKSE